MINSLVPKVQRPFTHPIHMPHTYHINFTVRSAVGRTLSSIRSPPARTFLGKLGFTMTSVTLNDIMFAFLAIWTNVRWR